MYQRNETDYIQGLSTLEKLMQHNIYLGMAVSDLANPINPGLLLPQDFNKIVALTGSNMGYELQLEGNVNGMSIPNSTRPLFLGVHQPTTNVNFSTMKESSIERIVDTMALADRLDADYFVIHPQISDYWEKLQNRERYIQECKDRFCELMAVYQERGYSFLPLIENLEFPKYPSTLNEILDAYNFARSFYPIRVGLALDIGHLWHSGHLINENLHNPSAAKYADEWSMHEVAFSQYLSNTFYHILEGLYLIHYTGCRNHETHLLPGALHDDRNVSVIEREYSVNELDIIMLREQVLHIAPMLNQPLFMVNEAIGYPYTQMIDNCMGLYNI